MRVSLRQLQIFCAVCDHGTTLAAADAVALSQSATSAGLNELEALLHIQLFDRVGKRLVINDNGRLLLSQARQILDATGTIEQQFAENALSGAIELHVGASTTIGIYHLPAILADFSDGIVYANLRVMVANTASIAAAVANFDVDFGLIEGPCHVSGLCVERWIADELIVVCAPEYPLLQEKNQRTQRKIPVNLLRNAHWLLREPGSGTREAVEYALIPHLHYLQSAGEFSNSEAIKHAAAAGLGLACLSRAVVADLIQLGKLVELDTTLPALQRYFYLIYRKDKILSVRLASFMQFCRSWKNPVL